MRNLLTIVLMFAFTAVTMAQTFPAHLPVEKQTNQSSNRNNVFVCPDETLFSQISQTPDNGFYCQQGYTYFLVADSYTATGSFSNFRFWGGDWPDCSLAPTESFDVSIWDGNPSAGGNLIFSQTLSGSTIPTGEFFASMQWYQIDIDLGTSINQLSGWIGITRNGATCGSGGFVWAAYDWGLGGDNYSFDGTNWLSGDSKLMFCLSDDSLTPPVPLSNYALYLGILLMITFVVIRFRRLM